MRCEHGEYHGDCNNCLLEKRDTEIASLRAALMEVKTLIERKLRNERGDHLRDAEEIIEEVLNGGQHHD